MSALPNEPVYMSEKEYLAFEHGSEVKHEYLHGEVIAMAGASDEHNLICASLIISIGSQLRGSDCKIYASDMRLKVEGVSLYAYPDVMVVCGEKKFAYGLFDTIVNPSLIVEILSPSTESYDRGDKFIEYRKISSLKEYVLVSQNKPHVDLFKRSNDGHWILQDADGLEASLQLSSIGCTLALAEIYEQISFPKKEDKNDA